MHRTLHTTTQRRRIWSVCLAQTQPVLYPLVFSPSSEAHWRTLQGLEPLWLWSFELCACHRTTYEKTVTCMCVVVASVRVPCNECASDCTWALTLRWKHAISIQRRSLVVEHSVRDKGQIKYCGKHTAQCLSFWRSKTFATLSGKQKGGDDARLVL